MSDIPIAAPDIPTRDSSLPNAEYVNATYDNTNNDNNNSNSTSAIANHNTSSLIVSSGSTSPQLMGLTAPLPPVPFPPSPYQTHHLTSVLPFGWYFDWVRANPGNARQVEKLLKTFTMIITDPANLINMEGCWSVSKLFTFTNDAILNTAGRRVPAREYLALALHAVNETECLLELVLRKYKGHTFTWNALLILEVIKLIGNATVHSQLFLMKWLWQSLMSSVRKFVSRITHHSATTINAKRGKLAIQDHNSHSSHAETSQAIDTPQNNAVTHHKDPLTSTALVIPRVISSKREVHTHFSGSADIHTANEYQEMQKEAEQVPCNWFDFLGVGVDCYLLLRPVLLVGAARHVYMSHCSTTNNNNNMKSSITASGMAEYCDESVARLPTRKHLQLTDNKNHAISMARTNESVSDSSENNKPISEGNIAADDTTNTNTSSKAPVPTAGPQDSLSLLQAIVNASPRRSLFSSWKWWLVFALMDVLVVFLSKLIKRKRVPVVYINEKSTIKALESEKNNYTSNGDAKTQLEQSGNGNNNNSAVANTSNGSQGHITNENSSHATGSAASELSASHLTSHEEDVNNNNNTTNGNDNNNSLILSRDTLRVTQSVRNLLLNILRDPFFATVLRQFIYNKFVQGKLNRIPLLGAILSFQVGYILSMQHYSFLYSAGQ